MSAVFFIVAHAGHPHLEPQTVLRWWTFEPVELALLAITLLLYCAGLIRNHKIVARWQATAFFAAWLALVIALVSPLDALGAILFSAHMVQHEALIVIAAPLLVLGRPLLVFLWGFPQSWRVPLSRWTQSSAVAKNWRAITGPFLVTILHALALWLWHLPSLYEATLRNDFVHALQHSSFLFTATLFWWALIHGRYGRAGYGVAVAYTWFTALHSGLLGALIAFAPRLVYPIYATRTAAWGLDAIEDQQLAGLLMWIPAGILFIILGIALFAAWLGEAERRVAFTSSEALRKEQRS